MANFFRQSDLAIDLGTSKIAVFARGEGLILEEPACIAFRNRSKGDQEVIAVGTEAALMRGKTPKEISVVRPIQNGVITECQAAGRLLRNLLAKAHKTKNLSRRRLLVGALYGANSMEQRAFEQVALVAGGRDIRLVAEPFAAAVGAGLPIDEPRASMVVDIGGGATEAIVVSLKEIVCGRSIRIGGDAMCEAIVNMLHWQVGLIIGLQEAKRLKEVATSSVDPNTWIEARGFDFSRRSPYKVEVQVGDIRAAMMGAFKSIAAMVKNVVDGLPADLAADLIGHGITLTGGGAAIEELRKMIEEVTCVEVKPLINPQQAVINGCGRMLEYFDYIA